MTTVFQLNIVEYPRVTIPATLPNGSDTVGLSQKYVFGIVGTNHASYFFHVISRLMLKQWELRL